jgi:uncharacterized tellurite resistance protein B-like protein
LLAWAIKTAVADGQVDLQEKRMLSTLAAKSGVTPDRLAELIVAGERGMLEIPEPPDLPAARAWLAGIADMAMCDGVVEPQELNVLRTAARKYGFNDSDVAVLLREKKAEHLAEARDALRVARTGGNGNSN